MAEMVKPATLVKRRHPSVGESLSGGLLQGQFG